MKIAFIGQKGIMTITGGVERRVCEVSTRMAKQGHELFVYARKNKTDKPLKKYKGVNLIWLPTISLKNLDAIVHTFLASVHAIFQDYDVVHYQAPGPSTLCWIIKVFRPDVTLVATFNSQDYKHQKWGWFARKYLQLGEKIISTVPDKTLVVSDILQDVVKDEYGKDAALVRNGAYVVRSEKTDFLEKHGLEKGKYFLAVSRLVKHKGIHYLINALSEGKKRGLIPNDFKVAVVGGGAYTDDYVKQITEMANKRDDIVLLGHQSDKEAHAQLFSHAFAYTQPSEAEGLSNALLEALGHGLIVIASDIPENKMPIGDNGLLFKNADENSLMKALAFAIENEKNLQKVGEEAAIATERLYNWQRNAEKTLSVYGEVGVTKQSIFKRNNEKAYS